MTLPPRNLTLKRLVLKDKPVLALDTGFDPDSLEGIRLVRASRGAGWFYHQGQLRPWTTKGVLQDDRRLVVWGDLDAVPEGRSPELWPQDGPEGREFLRAFVQAWTARAGLDEPLPAFSASAVLPWKTDDGWAFVFPPGELHAVLDSLQPLADRLPWDHYRHPDATGQTSWAFTSAALGVFLLARSLPWAQDEEAHLRQEIRTLKRTFTHEELPDRLDGGTLKLWFESLTGREDSPPAQRWKAWLAEDRAWDGPAADAARVQKREQARARRARQRGQAAFWRRRGTVVTIAAAGAAIVLFVIGSIVWGIIKPDPTDTWTPEQVVAGYYEGISSLDSEILHKLAVFDSGKEKALAQDQEEATNLYVIRQVRTAYEHQSPVVDAQKWETDGKPPVAANQMLYGLAGFETSHEGDNWTVKYRKWASESSEDKGAQAIGFAVVDHLTLAKTGRGWKIVSLQRDRQPLP
jgi:hypothetical protein